MIKYEKQVKPTFVPTFKRNPALANQIIGMKAQQASIQHQIDTNKFNIVKDITRFVLNVGSQITEYNYNLKYAQLMNDADKQFNDFLNEVQNSPDFLSNPEKYAQKYQEIKTNILSQVKDPFFRKQVETGLVKMDSKFYNAIQDITIAKKKDKALADANVLINDYIKNKEYDNAVKVINGLYENGVIDAQGKEKFRLYIEGQIKNDFITTAIAQQVAKVESGKITLNQALDGFINVLKKSGKFTDAEIQEASKGLVNQLNLRRQLQQQQSDITTNAYYQSIAKMMTSDLTIDQLYSQTKAMMKKIANDNNLDFQDRSWLLRNLQAYQENLSKTGGASQLSDAQYNDLFNRMVDPSLSTSQKRTILHNYLSKLSDTQYKTLWNVIDKFENYKYKTGVNYLQEKIKDKAKLQQAIQDYYQIMQSGENQDPLGIAEGIAKKYKGSFWSDMIGKLTGNKPVDFKTKKAFEINQFNGQYFRQLSTTNQMLKYEEAFNKAHVNKNELIFKTYYDDGKIYMISYKLDDSGRIIKTSKGTSLAVRYIDSNGVLWSYVSLNGKKDWYNEQQILEYLKQSQKQTQQNTTKTIEQNQGEGRQEEQKQETTEVEFWGSFSNIGKGL